jgi:hypothetical protein
MLVRSTQDTLFNVMRTNISKNQNTQIPSEQGRAAEAIASIEVNQESFIVAPKPVHSITIDLQFLGPDQARQLIKMFDSAEAYAENFSALKALTRGLYKIIDDSRPPAESPVSRMFHTVNNLQGLLLLDDAQEVDRIINGSGLMPNVWYGFNSRKGGNHAQ